MMNVAWRVAMLALALILSTCTAFNVAPSRFVGSTSAAAVARHQGVGYLQQQHTRRAVRYTAAGPCRAYRGQSMTAANPNDSKHTQAPRAAAVAGLASVVALTSAAVPAHADNFAEYFAQGIVGAINGPGILAVPIVLGFLLATFVAAFIFYFSQPREYDE